jgi:hypothetical protein
MIRMVVPVVAGFLLGIGSATAYVVTREEPKPLTAYLTSGDSITPAADSLAVPDSLPYPATDSVIVIDPLAPVVEALAPIVAPLPTAPAAEHPVAADSTAGAPGAPARRPLEQERVSRMFAAMKPQEAARVLEQLGDDEVRVLLSALSDRKAGAILSNLSPQRAAAISRPSLQTKE